MSRFHFRLRAVTRVATAQAIIFAALAGCASSGVTQGSNATASDTRAEVVGATELQSTAAANIYDAIQQLRPALFNGHGLGTPDVFIGNVKQPEGLSRLKDISVSNVKQVRYLRHAEAMRQLGSQATGGALIVVLANP